jgi:RNA polymerase sigma-70 factor (ECF subfamily)
MAPDDKQILDDFKNGKHEAFDMLITKYSIQLYQTAYTLLSNHHDAEEVVQETLVRAFRGLPSFRGDSGLGTWLQRIVTNLSRNKYHWNRRRGAGLNISIDEPIERGMDDCGDETMQLPDNSGGPGQVLENTEIESCLKNGMSALPESLRETIILRHVHDMRYEEIADVLHCKVGTVKSRLARGREMLREAMNKLGI